MLRHWFWFLIAASCLVWYSTIAIRGAKDIKEMLKKLGQQHPQG
jgi:hypothetical protein